MQKLKKKIANLKEKFQKIQFFFKLLLATLFNFLFEAFFIGL